MAFNVDKLEERIDKVAAGGTEIAMGFGGVKFATLLELMEFSKLMAVSGAAVPVHLRGNPGTCLAICTKALRFGFDPFSLAEHSYTMVKSMKVEGSWQDVESIAYDSFVIHAIIEAHGDVTGKLKPTYIGEGDDMKCICTGVVNGETLTAETDTVGKIKERIGRNEKGKLKGSPLWDSKPKQQLWYDARRDWCRAHQPHILLGWYDKDELQEHSGPEHAKDVTPAKDALRARLPGAGGRRGGFQSEHVDRETRSPSIVPDDATATKKGEADETTSVNDGAGWAVSESAQFEDGLTRQSTSPMSKSTVSEAAAGPTSGQPGETPGTDTGPAGGPSDAIGEAGANTDRGGERHGTHDAAPSLFGRFSVELFRVAAGEKGAANLKKAASTFWNRNEYPEDEAQKERLSRIQALHTRRVKGDIQDDDLKTELEPLVMD